MADVSIPVTPGTGVNIDGRTENGNGDFRQVVVLGDPTVNTGVAPVDATNGLSVNQATGIANTIDSIAASHSTDAIMNGNTALTPKFATISAAGLGDNTLIAAVTSKKIRVLAAALSFSGTVNGKFQSGAGGTDISKLIYGVAATNFVLPFNPVGWFETAAGVLLNLNLSGALAVTAIIQYVEV